MNGPSRTPVPTINNGCSIRILALIYVRTNKKPSLVREGGIDEPLVRVNDGWVVTALKAWYSLWKREFRLRRRFLLAAPVSELPSLCSQNANPCVCIANAVSINDTASKQKHHILRCGVFVLVTRTGIEPMFPAWEASVLTAWPTGRWLISNAWLL